MVGCESLMIVYAQQDEKLLCFFGGVASTHKQRRFIDVCIPT